MTQTRPPRQARPLAERAAPPAADPDYARPGRGSQPRVAKYRLGDVVKHRFFPFRGIIFDIDPVFASTEDWWQAIPEDIRPSKSQPYYHLLAENDKTEYIAYVSEQNLLPDTSGKPLRHPQVADMFEKKADGFRATFLARH